MDATVAPMFAGPTPRGRKGEIAPTGPLPIEGATEVDIPVEQMWATFCDVRSWPRWNACMWRARVVSGELRLGARLAWVFNPIERRYLYRLPAVAEIVEFEPHERVTWEVQAPGFHALHSYRFASAGLSRCRFGSWEVAEGSAYRSTQRFWIAHFRFVCRSSLEGAQALAAAAPEGDVRRALPR